MSSTNTSTPFVKTFLQPNDIRILPQHRLKVPQTNLIPTICFYNGTFVPIHAGHVNVLQETKDYINSLGTHELLGAYISPSHSGYVAKKLQSEEIIGAGHRLSMIYQAIENLDWVMVDLFELFQSQSTPLSIIMKQFISRIHSQLSNGSRMDVFWLKGEDALVYTRSSDHLLKLGFHTVYIVNRGINININDECETIQNYYEQQWQSKRTLSTFPERYHLIQAKHMNLSSSQIRKCARDSSVTWDQLQACIGLDKVTTYIMQHHLWSIGNETSCSFETTGLSEFPEDIEQLTLKLLSSMLSNHWNSLVKVLSFRFERIGQGKGWSGLVYRLYDIEYENSAIDADLPSSLVLKLSSGIWMGHEATVEPEFYLTFEPRISNIKIPKCYFKVRHPQSACKSLLLLQDLSLNYRSLGSKNSIDKSTVLFLVRSIACLHAEFFKHPILNQKTFSWLPSLKDGSMPHYQTVFADKMAKKRFTKRLETNLSCEAYTYLQTLLERIPHIFETLSNEKYTLAHGDFWINNMFVHRDQPNELILFDWQACCRANGLTDIAFLLRFLGSMTARSLESEVLQLYHQTLVQYGVSHYNLTSIREDYYSLALPYIFLVRCSWKNVGRIFDEILMILEDIVTFSKKH